jgi:pyruvate kinase
MHKKRTKIVCTIGPASASEAALTAMIEAGMNVARLNFSHGTHEQHAELIRMIRAVSERAGEPVAILQDLQGPKIRVGDLPKEGVTLKAGEKVIFTTGEADIAAMRLPVTYPKLHEDVKPGERILLDDGLLSAKVLSVEGREVTCEVIDGGPLTSHKGVNFPESKLTISSLSDKDRDDVRFGIEQRVDWVALSFVRTANEIRELRALIDKDAAELGLAKEEAAMPTRIIAKIEKREAVDNIDEILKEVDAIMVARGDLGIETPAEGVPVIQKMLIKKCLAAAKPVVVATQMLDSMIRNPRPTRAEVSDVANAVIDHADGVMLSGESAGGKYPVEAVQTMAAIVAETEASELDDLDVSHRAGDANSTEAAVSEIANVLVRDIDVKLILVVSTDSASARLVSRFRPGIAIAATFTDPRPARQTNVSRGVLPIAVTKESSEGAIAEALENLRKRGLVAAGDSIVLAVEEPYGSGRGITRVEVKAL